MNYDRASLNYVESAPFKTFIESETSQTAQPSIYLRSLAEHIMPVPPVREQEAIASYLRLEVGKINALVDVVRHHIEKLREYRTALISAVVTGKIDVRQEI